MIITEASQAKALKRGDVFHISVDIADPIEAEEAYNKLATEVEAILAETLNPAPSPIEFEFDGDRTIKLYISDDLLPAVVDGDARKKTVTSSPAEVTLQKNRDGVITVGDLTVPYV